MTLFTGDSDILFVVDDGCLLVTMNDYASGDSYKLLVTGTLLTGDSD